ncbi:hypothetical protein CSUB01_10530 [Colletotrichum sublineola]|uniref:Uncharacterized protein n=1 Tax=Colletotrichum sublineola TaxID=1173701 RepID=A0A066X6X0_COLSU|nr:hypothetical protein CSUB01_10530 [Colletotrichum sublineola]
MAIEDGNLKDSEEAFGVGYYESEVSALRDMANDLETLASDLESVAENRNGRASTLTDIIDDLETLASDLIAVSEDCDGMNVAVGRIPVPHSA